MKGQKFVISSENKELMGFLKKRGMIRRIRRCGIIGLYSMHLSAIRDRFELPVWEVRIKMWLESQLVIRPVKKRKPAPKKELSFSQMIIKNLKKNHSLRNAN